MKPISSRIACGVAPRRVADSIATGSTLTSTMRRLPPAILLDDAAAASGDPIMMRDPLAIGTGARTIAIEPRAEKLRSPGTPLPRRRLTGSRVKEEDWKAGSLRRRGPRRSPGRWRQLHELRALRAARAVSTRDESFSTRTRDRPKDCRVPRHVPGLRRFQSSDERDGRRLLRRDGPASPPSLGNGLELAPGDGTPDARGRRDCPSRDRSSRADDDRVGGKAAAGGGCAQLAPPPPRAEVTIGSGGPAGGRDDFEN